MRLTTHLVETFRVATAPLDGPPQWLPDDYGYRSDLIDSHDIPDTENARFDTRQAIRCEHLAGDFIPTTQWLHCTTITATRWPDTPRVGP